MTTEGSTEGPAEGPEVSVQIALSHPGIPSDDFIVQCVRHALAGVRGEVVVRVVDEAESEVLNRQYRGRQGPTNVLAFSGGEIDLPGLDLPPLGDIVICAPVLAREAVEQHKPVQSHWAHIVIHGCLHLAGYDHMHAADAETMESRERQLLSALGIADPYAAEH